MHQSDARHRPKPDVDMTYPEGWLEIAVASPLVLLMVIILVCGLMSGVKACEAPGDALPSAGGVAGARLLTDPCLHEQRLLLWNDPSLRNVDDVADNGWDFNKPGSIPGFGPIDADVAAAMAAQVVQAAPSADRAIKLSRTGPN